MKFFISYPREVREDANYLRAELEQKNIKTYLDLTNTRNCPDPWKKMIEEKIKESENFIILFNKSGHERNDEHFQIELNYIFNKLKKNGTAITILYPEARSEGVPDKLRPFHILKEWESRKDWIDSVMQKSKSIQAANQKEKKRGRIIPLSISFFSFLVILFMGFLNKKIFSPDPIKEIQIGISLAELPGDYESIGKDQEIGHKIAQKYLDEKYKAHIEGNKGGIKIKLKPKPTTHDPEDALRTIKDLAKGSIAVIGPTLSTQAVKILDSLDNFDPEPLIIAPSTTMTGLPQRSIHYYRVSSPVEEFTSHSIEAAINRIKKNSIEVIFIHDNKDDYAKAERDSFEDNMSGYTASINIYSIYPYKGDNFTPRKFRDIAYISPDIIFISGLARQGVPIIKGLRDNGYSGVIIAGNGMNSNNFLEKCSDFCKNVIVSQSYVYTYDSELNSDFKKKYAEVVSENNKELDYSLEHPPQFTAQTFTAIQILIEALNRIGESKISNMTLSQLREEVKKKLDDNDKPFDTVLGEIKFENGDIIQDKKNFSASEIVQGSDGKWKFKLID